MALRGHFRRQLGSSPAAYRAAYRARRPQAERQPDPEGPLGPPSAPSPLHPESGPVPLQTRRTPSPVGTSASLGPASDHGREAYAGGRASLPGQRSGM